MWELRLGDEIDDYCVKCRRRRSRIKWLKSGDKWRTERNGKEELKDLLAEEQNLKSRSKRLYENAVWPYQSKVSGIIERFVSRRMAGREDRQSGGAEEISLVESRIDEKHLTQTGWFFSDRLVKLMERVAGNSKGLGP